MAQEAYDGEEFAEGMYVKEISKATDKKLIKILKHNLKEEREHKRMLKEWMG